MEFTTSNGSKLWTIFSSNVSKNNKGVVSLSLPNDDRWGYLMIPSIPKQSEQNCLCTYESRAIGVP